jgi:carboxypeptidase T
MLRHGLRRLITLLLPLALTTAAGVMSVAAAPLTKYLVHVRVTSLAAAGDLETAGFDIAGFNKKDLTVGVVATDEDLARLDVMGYTYVIESANDALSIAALQDYTDPIELSAFVDQVVAARPDLIRKFALTGPLYEGQVQYAVEITKNVGVANERPVFVLDSQHHAREVMTAEIAKDMIDYLTSRYDTDPQVKRWVDNVDIYVVPSVNPDGALYVFQHDNMWRKNRHPSCAVDVNRNYPFAWGSCNGSSTDCSNETYRGFEPGSELETQGMLQLAADAHAFYALSYHTYGEYIMYSYGCQNPDEITALNEVAQSLNAILLDDAGQANSYTVGPIWSAIYLVDGGSVDTWYAQHGTYAFTIEASSSSFQPDYATWRDVTVQRQRTAWKFFLDRTLDGPQIRGKVVNAVTGQPVPATVSVQEVTFTHGESPRRAAPNGTYHWLARSGQTYNVTFAQPGYCSLTAPVSVGTGPATLDAALIPPTPPTGVTAAGNGNNRIDVSWSAAIGAVEYRVLRSLTSGGPFTEIGSVAAPQTSYVDMTPSSGAVYYYVVRAMQPCDSGNSSESSASTTGTCFAGPAFSGLAAAGNAGASTCGIELTWPAASAHCGGRLTYRLHRSTASPFTPGPQNLIAAGLSSTSYVDHDALVDGTTYYYIVRAVDAATEADDGNLVTRNATPSGPVASGTWTDDAGDTGSAALSLSGPWSVQPSGGRAGPAVYATGTYTNNLCAALTSPTLTLGAGAALSFATKYSIETGWDAGIVEIAEGPTFAAWTRLATVNYPDALGNTGNACGFPKTFTGTVFSRINATPAYPASNYTGSLGAYAGKDVKLRWRLGSDGTGTGTGWWVDDISVTNAVFRQVCAPGPAPDPGEPGAAGGPLTASRAPAGTGIDVTFAPACGTIDDVVYWAAGPIVGAPAWTQSACNLGTTGQATFDPGEPPPGEFIYFVIAGQSASAEGSYGSGYYGASSTERPEAVGIGACDQPQSLNGTCP